jgi:hypothetical protein
MKSAAVYQRLGRVFVTAEEGTDFGTREALPVMEVTGLPYQLLGRAVLFALDAYREAPRRPAAIPNAISPLHLLAGVKGWTKFADGAKCVEVTQRDRSIVLTPMRYEVLQGGHAPISEKEIVIERDELSIGSSLARAFGACESLSE